MSKKTFILAIVSIGYLVWAGSFAILAVQAQDEAPGAVTVARDRDDRDDDKDDRKPRTRNLLGDDFGKTSSGSAEASPTAEPAETPDATEPPRPTITPEQKSNSGALASIVDFF